MDSASSHSVPRIRVTFICQWYDPEPFPPPSSIARAVRKAGFDVSVLTAQPNYPTGVVAPGYRAWGWGRETIDGIEVMRRPVYPSHDRSALGRIANYLSWALTACFTRRRDEPDVGLVYTGPATAALPAMIRRFTRGTPFVLMVQDIWPDSVFASGFLSRPVVRKVVEPVVAAFVSASYRSASAVTVISPGAKDLLIDRGVPAGKIHLVYNWSGIAPAASLGNGSLRHDLGIDDSDFVLMYAGNHGPAQSLEVVVEAFRRVGVDRGCHLVFVGSGVEKARLVGAAADLPNVHFLEPVPASEVGALMREADAQLVSLADEPLFRVTMPSKLQGILANGLPVLVVAAGDPAGLVERIGAGVSGRPGDPDDIARAVLELAALPKRVLAAMGNSGRAAYETEMSEGVGAARLGDVLTTAARGRGRSVSR